MRSWKLNGLFSAILLFGCSSGEQNAPIEIPIDAIPPPPATPPPPPPDPPEPPTITGCSATLVWIAPTTREDDSPFPVHDIQYYSLFIGSRSGIYYRIEVINSVLSTKWRTMDLKSGLNYFSLTVTDWYGQESKHSDETVVRLDDKCTGD